MGLEPKPLSVHIVGSWSRPAWLSSSSVMDALGDPANFWRPSSQYLKEAQDDASRLAIFDQLDLGADIITDGEQRRQMFDRYFYARLSGVDAVHQVPHTWGGPAGTQSSAGWRRVALATENGRPQVPSPQVVGQISWPGPLSVDDFRFLEDTVAGKKPTKMTMSGPMTALNRLHDTWYHDRGAMAHDIAQALNKEAHALADAGCRFIQFDEPEFRAAHLSDPDLGVAIINETVAGLRDKGVTVFTHMCYGYANAVIEKRVNPDFYGALELMAATNIDGISIEYTQPGHDPGVLRALGEKGVVLGLINCSPDSPVETAEEVAGRLRGALTVLSPDKIHPSTDCGVWFLPRNRAQAKLRALVEGTAMVRREWGLA